MRAPDDAAQPFDLAAGEHATDVTLRMWKNGAITGRAVDAAGDPIVRRGGFRVHRVSRRRSTPVCDTSNDSHRRPWRVSSGRSPARPLRHRADSDALVRVSVVADLLIRMSPRLRRRGRSTWLGWRRDGNRLCRSRELGRSPCQAGCWVERRRDRRGYESHSALIRLLPADAPDTPPGFDVSATEVFAQVGGAGASDRQGAFTFTNVPPGKYVVRIVDYPRLVGPNLVRSLGGLTVGFPRAPVPDVDTMWAEVPVAVTDHDVADVPVMLTRAARAERTDRVRGRRRATTAG